MSRSKLAIPTICILRRGTPGGNFWQCSYPVLFLDCKSTNPPYILCVYLLPCMFCILYWHAFMSKPDDKYFDHQACIYDFKHSLFLLHQLRIFHLFLFVYSNKVPPLEKQVSFCKIIAYSKINHLKVYKYSHWFQCCSVLIRLPRCSHLDSLVRTEQCSQKYSLSISNRITSRRL